jgi:glycosyltransferase involved in cell wall biosynthesis
MMFGKPVVGCSVGGMLDVVADGVHGYLVPPGDAGALIEHLRPLLVNGKLRREFGLQSRKRYERLFTAEKMVANTLRFYSEIIEQAA